MPRTHPTLLLTGASPLRATTQPRPARSVLPRPVHFPHPRTKCSELLVVG